MKAKTIINEILGMNGEPEMELRALKCALENGKALANVGIVDENAICEAHERVCQMMRQGIITIRNA